MKRFISFVTCLLLLAGIPFCTFAEDQPERLIIAMINYETGAQNFSIEEAFFKAHPNATIEYRIYSSEQFNGVLMNGQCDFDLAVATYSVERAMLERGYIQTLDTIGLMEYPEQLIDLSHLLMVDGKLIGIPLWEVQSCYFWDAGLARKAGISYPASAGYWTWEDFASAAEGHGRRRRTGCVFDVRNDVSGLSVFAECQSGYDTELFAAPCR